MPLVPVLLIESTRRADGRLARLGLFALCYAVPQAAAYLIEMEHDGRLDQMRLAGRRPTGVAAAALVSVAAPWLLIGLALTAWSVLAGEATSSTLVRIAAIAGLPTMLAAISTTVRFAREHIDPRIGVVGLSVVSMAIGVSLGDLLTTPEAPTIFFVIALAVEAAVIAACIPGLPRRIAHPPVLGASSSVRFRPLPWEWILRWPGIYRGTCLSSNGLILFFLFAPVAILARVVTYYRSGVQDFETAGFYLPPLFIGLIAVSLICREDATSGRLDMVRQSSTRTAMAALQMLIGLWTPFVAASLGLLVLSTLLFGFTTQGLRFGAIAWLIMAPMPLLEGWGRLWPMMHMLPIGAAIAFLTLIQSWPAIAAISVVTWIAALRMLHQPERATIAGWPGVAALSALCAVAMLPGANDDRQLTGLGLVTIMVPMSPLLVDPGSSIHRWAQPVAVLLTTLLIGTGLYGIQPAAIVALAGLAAWFASYRIREWDPARPIVQAAIRVGLILLFGQIAGYLFENAPTQLVGSVNPLGVLAVALLLAAIVEVAFQIARFVVRKRPASILRA
jgi:hypothetical protein